MAALINLQNTPNEVRDEALGTIHRAAKELSVVVGKLETRILDCLEEEGEAHIRAS